MAKKVDVTFKNPVDETYIDHLELWRKTEIGGTFSQLGADITFITGTADYTYEDLTASTDSATYYYEARAYNDNGGEVEGTDYNKIAANITISAVSAYEPWNDANALVALLSNSSTPLDVFNAEDGTGGAVTGIHGSSLPTNSLGWNTFAKADIDGFKTASTVTVGTTSGPYTFIFYIEVTDDVIADVNQTYIDGVNLACSFQIIQTSGDVTLRFPSNVGGGGSFVIGTTTGMELGDKFLFTLTRDSSSICYAQLNNETKETLFSGTPQTAAALRVGAFGNNESNNAAPSTFKLGRVIGLDTEKTGTDLQDVKDWVLAGDLE